MLQKEFEERTGVKVDFVEFLDIHDAYMHCDLEKDGFCALWCENHKQRVRDSKKFAKVFNERRKRKELALNALARMNNVCDSEKPCTNLLSVAELSAIEDFGVQTFMNNPYCKGRPILDVCCELKKVLNS